MPSPAQFTSLTLQAKRRKVIVSPDTPATADTQHRSQMRPSPEEWDVPDTRYNCFNCNSMCCSAYERVTLSVDDVRQLALHFGISSREFRKFYTHRSYGETCLSRVPDELLGSTCILLDQERRLCGAHTARPEVCRAWPPPETKGRCVYYELLQFERSFQADPNLVIKLEIHTKPGREDV